MADEKQQQVVTGEAMDATHADYDELKPVWDACRAAAIGQRAIQKGKQKFLPALSGQDDAAYTAYMRRALFFNATGRTLEAMVGLTFRKAGVTELPQGDMHDWQNDITMTGISLPGVSRDVVQQSLEVGRLGILVDYPVAPAQPEGVALTVQQAAQQNLRPYMALYYAEKILNWDADRVGSVTKLVNVRLSECYDDEDGNEQTQVRELTLENGFYEVAIWRKVKNPTDKAKWFLFSRMTPLMGGQPLKDIPFWFIGPKEKGWNVCDPPIEDLVYVNISHYMNSADLENGAHVSGLPTPYITGINKDDGGVMNLGTGTAWLIPNENAKVGFCQVGSEGFASLEKLMDRKEQQMAALGARLVAPEKKAPETAETAQIRRGGENSALGDIVRLVAKSVENVLLFMRDWGGITGDLRFTLNTDFLPAGMTAQDLTALLAAVQSGKMSFETFFEALKAGEVVSESLTFEEEQQRIADDGPALGTLADPGIFNANGQ